MSISAGQDAASEDKSSRGQASYAVLDQSLWMRFQSADTSDVFLESWLGLVVRQLDGLATGLLLTTEASGSGQFSQAANWPAGNAPAKPLVDVAREALETRHSVVQGEGAEMRFLAHPILVFGEMFGAVAVAVPSSAPPTPALFRRLQWGAGWIELLLRREQEAKDGELRERVTVAFDMLAALLDHPRLDDAANALVTELARRFDCETVSLGFTRRNRTRLEAVSSASSFGRRATLIRETAFAMDEAIDQEAVILWPAPEDWEYRVSRSHEELAQSHGVGSVLTIPLTSQDQVIGALTFERRKGAAFVPAEIEAADAVAAIAGPILEDRRLANRWLVTKIGSSILRGAKALVGPSHFGVKLATLVAAGVVALLWLTPRDYSVVAPGRLEGVVQRSLVAPFNSYLAGQSARAGDLVEEGEVLAVLDDRDLSLEQLRLATARQQRVRELDRAIASRELAEANIIRAQLEQTDAQLALVAEQLARTRIRAPFSGYVVEGDLSQSVGTSVERGQTLLRIAPLDGFRVILEVDEKDIEEVAVGQVGTLRLSAFPESPLEYDVTAITPLARQSDGRNYFRVEADLNGGTDKLRPGMEGVSRTAIGERRLAWVMFHDLIDWARLVWWRWEP